MTRQDRRLIMQVARALLPLFFGLGANLTNLPLSNLGLIMMMVSFVFLLLLTIVTEE